MNLGSFKVKPLGQKVNKHLSGLGRCQSKVYYKVLIRLTFRHRASCILGQAFHYSPENAFYIFNQQIYFII